MIPFLGPLIEKTGSVLDNLFTTDEERLKAQGELQKLKNELNLAILKHEETLINAQKSILEKEYEKGSWLARNWRPLLMATFIAMIGHRYLVLPIYSAMSELFDLPVLLFYPEPLPENVWSLLQIGLGGYIVGRSAEKVAKSIGGK